MNVLLGGRKQNSSRMYLSIHQMMIQRRFYSCPRVTGRVSPVNSFGTEGRSLKVRKLETKINHSHRPIEKDKI